MDNAQWDTKIGEKTQEGRALEEKRETLNKELSTLSLQANARAKLDHVRSSIKSHKNEVSNMYAQPSCSWIVTDGLKPEHYQHQDAKIRSRRGDCRGRPG
jgi:hypothetical protein